MRKPDSLRSMGGISYLGLDRRTKDKLRELAGDMPVSHFVRGLAFGTIELPKRKPGTGAQEPLPGQEHLVSPATIHSVAADMAELKASYTDLELMICDIARSLGIKRLNTGLLRPKVQDEVRSMPVQDSSQSELSLG